MSDPVRVVDVVHDARPAADAIDPEQSTAPTTAREWIVTNGLGGYASGTVSGLVTRRFHGLLVAALAEPLGRTMMLNFLAEQVVLPDGTIVRLGAQPRPGGERAREPLQAPLVEFRLELGLPIWTYAWDQVVLEKRLFLLHRQNTVHVTYRRLRGDEGMRLELEPFVHFRRHEGPVDQPAAEPYSILAMGDRYEIRGEDPFPALRLKVYGARPSFLIDGKRLERVPYPTERARGYDSTGELQSPGLFRADLLTEATIVASTDPWEAIGALSPTAAQESERRRRATRIANAHPAARDGLAAELVLAADHFVIVPAGRVRDTARAHAAGDETRTVIAGYPWFTDWGRDTMISLEGLALLTGRQVEAAYVLRTFAYYVKDGLIPNMFPEGTKDGLYNTADATLWFFHALARYVRATGDRATLHMLLPTLVDIVSHHVKGTRFGIGVDPADGLLRQGAEGYQLTWMDAKVGDLVVTPRRGKAVEINALFYDALCWMDRWAREEGRADADTFARLAARVQESFNRRFWYEKGGHLYDVVDGEGGDDPSFRPNQLLALSLEHPVLDRERWRDVVGRVEEKLLTPVGLRSLAPSDPNYKPKYFGDLRARDLAYHEGTVWAWLIGPFVDAWLKVHPGEEARARAIVERIAPHLNEACVGTISEIFDAEAPYTPRGCVSQAWSVAEYLRVLVKTSGA
ncbi:MAG TPA: amylo-alpha-1,6-glucosidase [Polyangiaceae bacterium]